MSQPEEDECAERGRLSLELFRALEGWSSGILSLGLTFTSDVKVSSSSCQPAQEPPPSHPLPSPSASLRLPSPSLPSASFHSLLQPLTRGAWGQGGRLAPTLQCGCVYSGLGLGRREGKWVSTGRDRTVARGQGSCSLTPPVRQ